MAATYPPRGKRPTKDLLETVRNIAHATPEQLRDGYLNRLRRLLRLRRDNFEDLNEQGLRLLDQSIFASYCDCLDIGQGDEAKSILKNVRLTLSLTRTSQRNQPATVRSTTEGKQDPGYTY